MPNPLEKLKNRVFGKKHTETELTGILEMVRGFGCLGDLLGRNYEVIESKKIGVLYEIRQRPLAIAQVNMLLKEFDVLLRLDNEREAAKWGKKKPRRLRKR